MTLTLDFKTSIVHADNKGKWKLEGTGHSPEDQQGRAATNLLLTCKSCPIQLDTLREAPGFVTQPTHTLLCPVMVSRLLLMPNTMQRLCKQPLYRSVNHHKDVWVCLVQTWSFWILSCMFDCTWEHETCGCRGPTLYVPLLQQVGTEVQLSMGQALSHKPFL